MLKSLFYFVIIYLNFEYALLQSIPPQCLTSYELNIDYKGEDLFSQPTFLTSVEFCCSLCYNYTTCGAWTYVPDVQACWLKSYKYILRLISSGRMSGTKSGFYSTFIPSTPTTTIFTPITFTITTPTTSTLPSTTTSSTSSSTSSTTTTSVATNYGCFIENDINYYGNDLSGSFVTDPTECCNLCGKTINCMTWSYLVDIKYCYLKNAVPSIDLRLNYTGIISGIVTLR